MAKIAGAVWISLVQYFVVLVVVQSQWTTPYSWVRNAISDLGAETCFHFDQDDAWVCSPWHAVANLSWIAAGCCLAAGALLALREFGRTRLARTGLACFAVSGIGLMVVGLCPEDTSTALHVAGAMAAIPLGALGTVLTALAMVRAGKVPVVGRIGIALGATGIAGFPIFLAGIGGPGVFGFWERMAAFPGMVWAIVLGIGMLTLPRADHIPEAVDGGVQVNRAS